MSGSEGGSGKRTGGNAGTAPRPDPYLVVDEVRVAELALDHG